MKLINAELKNVAEAIMSLRSERLEVKTALAITGNVATLNKAATTHEETRVAILESYCKKGEDGKPIFDTEEFTNSAGEKQSGLSYQFDTPEIKAECIAKINELANTEVEVNLLEITKDDILKETKLSPDQISILLLFTKEE